MKPSFKNQATYQGQLRAQIMRVAVQRGLSCLIFLSVCLSNVSAADEVGPSVDDYVRLEFPTLGQWSSTNEFGVLKWRRPLKYAVWSTDMLGQVAISQQLTALSSSLPASLAGQMSEESIGHDGNYSNVDVVIWISNTPWQDAKGVLSPFVQRLGQPNEDVGGVVETHIASGSPVFAKFKFDRMGSMEGGLLIVDREAVPESATRLLASRFLLASLSPRLFAPEVDGYLFNTNGLGQLCASRFSAIFFDALYDPLLGSGAPPGEFAASVTRALKRSDSLPTTTFCN
jgi:hypothetical protein